MSNDNTEQLTELVRSLQERSRRYENIHTALRNQLREYGYTLRQPDDDVWEIHEGNTNIVAAKVNGLSEVIDWLIEKVQS